jgi:hypothetical protein
MENRECLQPENQEEYSGLPAKIFLVDKKLNVSRYYGLSIASQKVRFSTKVPKIWQGL